MALIAPFPRKAIQADSPINDMIRKFLDEVTSDDKMVDQIASRMKTFVDAYADVWFQPAFNLAVPPNMSREETTALLFSIEYGVDRAAEQVNEIISKIVVERLLFEIQLYENGQYPYFSKPASVGRTADKKCLPCRDT